MKTDLDFHWYGNLRMGSKIYKIQILLLPSLLLLFIIIIIIIILLPLCREFTSIYLGKKSVYSVAAVLYLHFLLRVMLFCM
jgi:hypothetical protein